MMTSNLMVRTVALDSLAKLTMRVLVSNDGITAQDTQETENIVTLERTSYNFLE